MCFCSLVHEGWHRKGNCFTNLTQLVANFSGINETCWFYWCVATSRAPTLYVLSIFVIQHTLSQVWGGHRTTPNTPWNSNGHVKVMSMAKHSCTSNLACKGHFLASDNVPWTHKQKTQVQRYVFKGKNTQGGTEVARGSKVGSADPTMGP